MWQISVQDKNHINVFFFFSLSWTCSLTQIIEMERKEWETSQNQIKIKNVTRTYYVIGYRASIVVAVFITHLYNKCFLFLIFRFVLSFLLTIQKHLLLPLFIHQIMFVFCFVDQNEVIKIDDFDIDSHFLSICFLALACWRSLCVWVFFFQMCWKLGMGFNRNENETNGNKSALYILVHFVVIHHSHSFTINWWQQGWWWKRFQTTLVAAAAAKKQLKNKSNVQHKMKAFEWLNEKEVFSSLSFGSTISFFRAVN